MRYVLTATKRLTLRVLSVNNAAAAMLSVIALSKDGFLLQTIEDEDRQVFSLADLSRAALDEVGESLN